jgi:hypothetical protein
LVLGETVETVQVTFKRWATSLKRGVNENGFGMEVYFATSTQRISRMTVMRIWPGYWSSFSILEAMSRVREKAWSLRILGSPYEWQFTIFLQFPGIPDLSAALQLKL